MRQTLLVVPLLLLALASAAGAQGPAVLGLEAQPDLQRPAPPAQVVEDQRDGRKLEVQLTDAAGRRQTLRAQNLGAGSVKTLSFKHGQGTTAYKAELDVTWGDGSQETFTVDFEATRVGKLVMDITPDDVDIDGRKVKARVNNPAASIELVVMGESGAQLWSGRESFDPPAPAGTDLSLSWDEPSEKILTMHLKIYDIAGYWVGMQISPFTIEI